MPASGHQDHTILPSAIERSRLQRSLRPPHPAPRFVTLRNAPLSGAGRRLYGLICAFGKSEYFFTKGWTEGSTNRPGDLPDPANRLASLVPAPCGEG
jgi:hypothetical protein